MKFEQLKRRVIVQPEFELERRRLQMIVVTDSLPSLKYVYGFFKRLGISLRMIHDGVSPQARDEKYALFSDREVRLLITTQSMEEDLPPFGDIKRVHVSLE